MPHSAGTASPLLTYMRYFVELEFGGKGLQSKGVIGSRWHGRGEKLGKMELLRSSNAEKEMEGKK
jgi:hypothetical protein